MKDENKTKKQLIEELVELRRKVAELEALEVERKVLQEQRAVKIGEILVEMGYLRQLQLKEALQRQSELRELGEKHERLGQILVESGLITGEQVRRALAIQETVVSRVTAEAIEGVLEAVIIMELDGIIRHVNSEFEESTGWKKEEVIGKTIFELGIMSEAEAQKVEKELVPKLMKQGFVRNVETIAIRKNGAEFPALMSWTLTTDAEGRPTGIISAARDITERKWMEAELLKVQKLESIGVLAGGIAHDFNNILTGILGSISLASMHVETGKTTDKVIERLAGAERACMQAKDLTQQLLTFSRGGLPIKKMASIGELLKDSAIFASRGSNVRCEFSIPDDLWPAEIDEGQMNQVIGNLVINADQAMASGGIVKVRAENMIIKAEYGLPVKEGEYVKISIEDHGIGIPEDDLPKIFDPYFTTKKRGSGLGLSTSYFIVRNHDGHITAESQMGVGTTFHIYLPASPEEVLVVEEKEEGKPIMGVGRILVMDDEELVREVVSDMLTNVGYEVITAVDGAEAISLYKEAMESGNPFGAVIMDLTIPGGMGGKETIQKLIEMDSEAKVIVSSGYSNHAVMADFEKYGFKGVIAKPYKTRELSEILRRVIAGTGNG
jgi:PAS domain S-box-containing protein